MNKKDKLDKLKGLMKDINKKQKDVVLDFASSQEDWKRLSSGVEEFDGLVGNGFPYGHTSIIWGSSGAGKSSLMYSTVAQAQKDGKIVAFLDLENSFSNKRAEIFGVNCEELIIGRYSVAEQALDTIIKLAKEEAVDVIVCDSLHSMAPKGEQEDKKGQKSLESDTMALLARKLAQFFRMASTYIYKANICLIFIGQTRTDLGGFIALQKLSGGNCFDEKTRVLTCNGLKNLKELKEGDVIPTINLEKNCVENKPVKKKFIYDYNDKLIEFKNKYSKHFLFTPNHTCLVKTFRYGSLSKPYYQDHLASEPRRTMAFPICFPSGNKEYNISDENLKALAWFLTDSTINKSDKFATNWKKYSNKITVYQTKHADYVEDVLNKSSFQFKRTIRKRKIKREEFKNTKPSSEFYIYDAKNIIKKYNLTPDKLLPEWMFKLSDRQAKLFIKEINLADGSSEKNYFKALYKGNLEWIEKIAQLCVTHNIPVSHIKKQNHKKCWILLFQQHDYVGFKKHQIHKRQYKGKIWDILVDNNYHWIERNGQLILTHNSLIHNSVLTVHVRRGAKKNNPTIDYKEAWIDPDGKFHLNTRHEDAGFSVVLKIDKKQCDGGKNEGSDLEIPYYFETGFKNPYEEKEELPIIIDPTANEEEREQIIKELENKDKLHLVKGFEKILPQIKKGDVIISETENEIIEEAVDNLKEEKPKKKKRGRPKKEKK